MRLHPGDIERLLGAALRAGLLDPERRPLLYAGLEIDEARLPRVGRPLDQLRTDLDLLADPAQMRDHGPLVGLLENAARLAGEGRRAEARVFEQMAHVVRRRGEAAVGARGVGQGAARSARVRSAGVAALVGALVWWAWPMLPVVSSADGSTLSAAARVSGAAIVAMLVMLGLRYGPGRSSDPRWVFLGAQPDLQVIRGRYLDWLERDVRGRFESSIHAAHFMHIEAEEQRHSTRPWSYVAYHPDESARVFADFEAASAFYGGQLLLLGAPGSGKTTTLMRAVLDRIDAARADPDRPVPVLLNLSRFAPPRQEREAHPWLTRLSRHRLDDWLIAELARAPARGLNVSVARAWVMAGEVELFLDGLDEVESGVMREVVHVINAEWLDRYPDAPMCVASRIQEYAPLSEVSADRLRLTGAIALQPLGPADVRDYLRAARAPHLGELLERDGLLAELAQSPLTLSMMVLAYGGRAAPPPALPTLAEQRRHLLDAYVDRMVQRHARRARGVHYDSDPANDVEPPYRRAQVNRWLGWLAVGLGIRARTSFDWRGIFALIEESPVVDGARRPFERRLIGVGRVVATVLVCGCVGGLGRIPGVGFTQGALVGLVPSVLGVVFDGFGRAIGRVRGEPIDLGFVTVLLLIAFGAPWWTAVCVVHVTAMPGPPALLAAWGVLFAALLVRAYQSLSGARLGRTSKRALDSSAGWGLAGGVTAGLAAFALDASYLGWSMGGAWLALVVYRFS